MKGTDMYVRALYVYILYIYININDINIIQYTVLIYVPRKFSYDNDRSHVKYGIQMGCEL
jgi:uncharacterized membrane protein